MAESAAFQVAVWVPLVAAGSLLAARLLRVPASLGFFGVSVGGLYAIPSSLPVTAGSAAAQRVFGLLVIAAVAALALQVWSGQVALERGPVSRGAAAMVLIPLLLAAVSLIVGTLRGNAAYFLASDVLRLCLSGLALALGLRLPIRQAMSVAVAASLTAVGADLLSLAQYFLAYVGGRSAFLRAGGGYPTVLGLGAALVAYGSRGRVPSRRRAFRWGVVLLAMDLAAAMLSLFRALWIGIALFFGAVGIAGFRWPSRRGLVRALGALAAAGLLGLGVLVASGAGDIILNRLATLRDAGSSDLSVAVRVWEYEHVKEELRTSPTGWVLGVGAGATIDFPELGEPEWHQVHNSFAQFLLRTGLLGLLLYGGWWLGALWVGLRLAGWGSPAALWSCAVVLVGLVQAITAASFVGLGVPEFAIGVGLQLLGARDRHGAVVGPRPRTGRSRAGSPRP